MHTRTQAHVHSTCTYTAFVHTPPLSPPPPHLSMSASSSNKLRDDDHTGAGPLVPGWVGVSKRVTHTALYTQRILCTLYCTTLFCTHAHHSPVLSETPDDDASLCACDGHTLSSVIIVTSTRGAGHKYSCAYTTQHTVHTHTPPPPTHTHGGRRVSPRAASTQCRCLCTRHCQRTTRAARRAA
jgi:hypothetical protein